MYRITATNEDFMKVSVDVRDYSTAYAVAESLKADDSIFDAVITRVNTAEELERIEALKAEVAKHFDYYGKEIQNANLDNFYNEGYYVGYDKDEELLDSMVRDLEGSIRVLKEIKGLAF